MINREFLKGLGIADEAIDKIMNEHGIFIESNKNKIQTLNQTITDLTGQLDSANKQIKAFEDMDIDNIKNAAAEWEEKAKKAQKDSDARIYKMQFDHSLEKALTGAKAKNAKAVQALLNMDELKYEDGKITGLDKQLEAIKKDNDYLFEAEEGTPPPQFTQQHTFSGGASSVDARAIMGLPTN